MKIHVIIPMAGKGTRFAKFGFKTPKFLLPLDTNGQTMIHAAVDTLNVPKTATYTFITLKDIFSVNLEKSMKEYDAKWVLLDNVTDGPATTVFQGMTTVPENTPLIISNSDQVLVNWDFDRFVNICQEYDGGVLTYTPPYPITIGDNDKHSFVKIENRKCISFAEKIVLSDQALIGVHYFRSKQIFIDAYNDMIKKNERAPNGEFYISLQYNALIRQGKTVVNIPLQPDEYFYPTGEPADYFTYLNNVTQYGPKTYDMGKYLYHSDDLIVYFGLPALSDDEIFIDLDTNTVHRRLIEQKEGIVLKSPYFVPLDFTVIDIVTMKRGWLIGDFMPSVFRTKLFEIGVLTHKKNEKIDYHIHDYLDEYNYIINGHTCINGIEYQTGDKFAIYHGHPAVPTFAECKILCIKTPSIPTDKRLI